MKILTRTALALLLVVPGGAIFAQSGGDPKIDHQAMLAQLGVTQPLRPGADKLSAKSRHQPNYDESKAAAKSPVPPLLVMADGRNITTPALWDERRKELMEIFDREFYGRVPEAAKTIGITWQVEDQEAGKYGDIPTLRRSFSGQVDPRYHAGSKAFIFGTITTPLHAAGKVPVIVEFNTTAGGSVGRGRAVPTMPELRAAVTLDDAQAAAIERILEQVERESKYSTMEDMKAISGARFYAKASSLLNERQALQLAELLTLGKEKNPLFPNLAQTWQEAALSLGWGIVTLHLPAIQSTTGGDNLKQGIIGFINKGQSRKPDDWGVLRAWAWGAQKAVDYLETDPHVDGKQVAFAGEGRNARAVLLALAYEPRAAFGYVSNSGAGGAKLWRHLMGETVENLADPAEYQSMAGNFLKYAGPKTVDDLPADAHQLIALVAPRPVFIGGGGRFIDGEPTPGSNRVNRVYRNESWEEAPGMFMATAGASPVWKLLGKKPLGNDALGLRYDEVPDPSQVKLPPVRTPLIDGDIAFRQVEAGSNWSTFIQFAQKYFKSPGFKN